MGTIFAVINAGAPFSCSKDLALSDVSRLGKLLENSRRVGRVPGRACEELGPAHTAEGRVSTGSGYSRVLVASANGTGSMYRMDMGQCVNTKFRCAPNYSN